MDRSVRVEEIDGWAVVRLHGDLDLASAPRVREQLLEVIARGHQRLIVDLDDVGLVDSMGLGILVGVLKRARAAEGDLRLVSTQPSLRRTFELTDLDQALPLADSVDAAVGARRPGRS